MYKLVNKIQTSFLDFNWFMGLHMFRKPLDPDRVLQLPVRKESNIKRFIRVVEVGAKGGVNTFLVCAIH